MENQIDYLRQYQLEDAEKIIAAFHKSKAFLLASELGTGKTRVACEVAKRCTGNVLIIAPLSTFGGWLKEAEAVGLDLRAAAEIYPGAKALLINYERLDRYSPVGTWDDKFFRSTPYSLIIWDECHRLGGLKTKRWKIFSSFNATCNRTLFLSATPAQSPLNMAYLQKVIDFKNFWPWVKSFRGIKTNYWGGLEYKKHPEDEKYLDALLKKFNCLRRTPQDIGGWPEINRSLFPIRLNAIESMEYHHAMEDYIDTLSNKRKYQVNQCYDLVACGQFRKKVSALKTPYTLDLTKTLLDQNKVVCISCEYLNPATELYNQLGLEGAGYKVALITGNTIDLSRRSILECSMDDKLDVIIFTTKEGINLQQNLDCHRERVQIDHDVRWSGIDQTQVDGRVHRNGRFALIYWMVCAGTIDERVAKVLKERMETIGIINGDMNPEDYIYGNPEEKDLTCNKM